MATDNSKVTADVESKHPAIKAMEEGYEPWKAQDFLKVMGKDSTFAYRWVAKENIADYQSDYWEVVSFNMLKSRGLIPDAKYGTSTTSTVERGNLILMRIPKVVSDKRDAYFAQQNRDAMKNEVKAFAEKAVREGDAKTGAYADIQFGK